MRRRGRGAAIVVALLALGTLVTGAQAQGANSGVLYAIGTPGGKPVSETNIQVAIQGQLTVNYHGDAGSGCAAYGLCAYAGTIVVRPTSGSFAVVSYRHDGRIRHQVELVFAPSIGGYTTAAVVQRSSPGGQGGTCADAQSSPLSGLGTQPVHGRSVTIRLLAAGGSLLTTRCAGPVDGDLAAASPTATVPLRRLERGGISIDLGGTHPFAAHGFAGTITSTVVLKLGRPQPPNLNPSFPPGVNTARIRTVTETLRLERISGHFSAALTGSGDPVVCTLLDTCGLTGTLSLAPAGREVSAQVIATGRASLPYTEFLTALGLRPGPRPRGISVLLFASWGAEVSATIQQAGATCTDTAPVAGVAAVLTVPAGGAKLLGSASSGNSWRTRCPGPSFSSGAALFSASAPAGALRHPRLKITLRASARFGDDGYLVTPRGNLSLVLRRGRISQSVQVQPTG
jgi:hypothetical protein